MTSDLKLRISLALFVSIFLAVSIYMQHRENAFTDGSSYSNPYFPIISGYLFPALVLVMFVILLVKSDIQTAFEQMITIWFGDLVHLGIYYVLLMLILPVIRKFISAKACAVLWIIPNYLFLNMSDAIGFSAPLIVFHASQKLIWTLFYIWMIGFWAIILWNIISHLCFRHWILKNSTPITDPDILEIWTKEYERSGTTKKFFRLVTSPQATTPVSIGLTRWTVRVILPEISYTPEELSLIFRHELVHIVREDAWTKFFLMFCNALFWFNPIMWISRRKCSEDLELSCDEVVLFDCDDAARRKYASLILDTAGEESGFTTCLSASAAAMRYRLKNIVKPNKKFSGAIISGIIFFLLLITNGGFSLAYHTSTGYERIYQSRESEAFELSYIMVSDYPYNIEYHWEDPDTLYHYLSNLVMEEITGKYTYEESNRELNIQYNSPEGLLSLILYDNAIRVIPLYERSASQYYYLPDGTDWKYLDSILMTYPTLDLNLRLSVSGIPYMKNLRATPWTLKKIKDSETTLLLEHTHPLETPSGMIGFEADEAILDFSHTLVSDFTVTVEAWDGSQNYTISGSSLETPMVLPLADYPARYMICGKFLGYNGVVYDAEFRFDFGEMDE